MKFSIKDFFSKCDQIRSFLTADLIRFTEEIFHGQLHFLYSVRLLKIQGEIVSQNVNKILNFLSYIASLPQ